MDSATCSGAEETENETDGVIDDADDVEIVEARAAERRLKLRRDLPHNPQDTEDRINSLRGLFPGIKIEAVLEWSPEQIQILRDRGVLFPEKADGSYNGETDTVILNVSNLRPSDVPFKLMHEAGIHGGLRRAFGDAAAGKLYHAVFDMVKDSPEMKRIIDRYKLRTERVDENGVQQMDEEGNPLFDDMTDDQINEAGEEYLAYFGETYGVPIQDIFHENQAAIDAWGRENGRDTHNLMERERITRDWMSETGYKPERPAWWKRMISGVRVWLASHGYGNLRDADIETIIMKAAKAASSRKRGGDGNRFSLNEDRKPLFNCGEYGKLTFEDIISNQDISEYTPILTDNGSLDWGYITKGMIKNAPAELNLKEYPIRLFRGDTGFGLIHMSKHFEQFGISDVSSLIEHVFGKPNKIYARRDGNVIRLEVVPKPPTQWGILELREEKGCYSVVSLYPRQNNYSKAKGKQIWEYGSQAVSSQAANELSRNGATGQRPHVAQEELKAKSDTNIDPFGINSRAETKKNEKKFSLPDESDGADVMLNENFRKWFGDSKVVDEDGKPLVVYHGSDSDFTVFDVTKGRANMDIQGMFFSPWELDAKGYGKNVRAFYLSIQNPASEDAAYRALNKFKGQNEAGIKARKLLESMGYDGVNVGEQEYIAFKPEQIKSATDNVGTYDGHNPDIRFSLVTDQDTINRLEAEEYLTMYRAAQIGPDGKLHSPMAGKINGKWGTEIVLGKWEQADEHPELIKVEDGKNTFNLNKGNGSSVPAAYNPYIHSSAMPLNDQFTTAYKRPNLVTIEVHVPKSELDGKYKAEYAKDAVGMMQWPKGPVAGKLPKSKERKVMLSRWDKPIRIVPDSEVAQKIAKILEGENIPVPSNVVTPSLRNELEKLGVPIVETVKDGKVVNGKKTGESATRDVETGEEVRADKRLEAASPLTDVRYDLDDDRIRDYIKVLKPYVGMNLDMPSEFYAEKLKEKCGLDIDPVDARILAYEAMKERKKEQMRKQWADSYSFFQNANPMFDFLCNFCGSSAFVVKPAYRFQGEDFTGSFISPEFVMRFPPKTGALE